MKSMFQLLEISSPNGALFSTDAKPATKQEQTTALKRIGASGEQVADTKIIGTLAKYLWMKDNVEFRLRVIAALGLLIGAKVINVQVPFLFKLAVDWLATATGNAGALAEFTAANSTILALFASPAAILIGYGIARSGASAFNELRTAIFSKVALRTIRQVSRKVFSHLHELDLRYHLSRETGALNRTIDRGSRAINFILSSMVFNVVPTILEIKIDGQDVRTVTLESLRKSIGVVPQDTVLFNDTIFHNIHYGCLSATEEEVYDAARRAAIHDTIMNFPEKYSTVVGERGLKLSGGEKQRVALARTFLKAPPILLCDEATSALDSTTEAEILNALKSLANDRTSIFIAHRLTTAMQCDEIVVLENGRVVEQGPHDVLLSKSGRYAQLWTQQNSTVDAIDAAIKLEA
ncbi:UNVERIFIED_CONTAM: ABC transporter B family member 25 [Sesamum calycinum]|uniref:ABC transporter B family member 25 n=1 Tax=Sesamum calycinum TaxID=2727403 RepID=A0AAW2S9T8_9LAMI